LQGFKQQEQAEILRVRSCNLSRLEEDLTRLLKQAFVEGFYPLQLQSSHLSLSAQETLHWESPGWKLKQRTRRGTTYWQTELQGTLLVTSERILLDSPPHKLWQRPLSKLCRVDWQCLPQGPIIVLWFDGLQKPIGLGLLGLQVSVMVGDHARTLKLVSGDLARVLEMLGRKAK
jgi:hypothetical protein